MKTLKEAKESLVTGLIYFRHAVETAKANGTVKLGIISTAADGSSKLEMSFECEEFFQDLELMLEAPPQSEEDGLKAKALSFIQKHGIKKS